DVSDYRDIDPTFGSLEDFDELVEAWGADNLRKAGSKPVSAALSGVPPCSWYASFSGPLS
ncbi:MAG: hypothetical protein AAF199_10475, partial [Pseudomonadota bacterium]